MKIDRTAFNTASLAMPYSSFTTAIYCTAGCLQHDTAAIASELDFFQKHMHITKAYIENHRGNVSLDRIRLLELKALFEERGIAVAGGITPTLGEEFRPGYRRLFGVICYTDAASRHALQSAVETAASVFDEIILDDFFFTNCACDDCIEQKGSRGWGEFRRDLMLEVSEELVIKPAKQVNPTVRVIIKYPNWNEAYADTGYDTERQSQIFDGIYAGTETRDPSISQQHIPRYASYSLLRWTDSIRQGGGAWFDSLDCTSIDNYLEQANLSVFGKAKELTLFCYSLLKNHVYAPALGFQLQRLDGFALQLGKPVGVPVYLPHRASGEDHLYDYLGMAAIPLEPIATFPLTANGNAPLLLTAGSASDPEVLVRLQQYLRLGGEAIMTSGFIEQMQGRGIESLTTLRPTGRHIDTQLIGIHTNSCTFNTFAESSAPISLPVFDYSTNGTWQSLVAIAGQYNIPLLMYDNYGKGRLHTLIIPDHPADLWRLPEQVLDQIRHCFTGKLLPYQIKGPAHSGWFAYDNNSFVLANSLDRPQTWQIVAPLGQELVQLEQRQMPSIVAMQPDGSTIYAIRLAPSEFVALQWKAITI